MPKRRFSVWPIRLIRRVRLRTRLLAAFLLLSLIPALLLTALSLRIYADSIVAKLSQSAGQTTQLMNHNLTLLLDGYDRYLDLTSVSDSVQLRLSGQGGAVSAADDYRAYASSILTTSHLRDTLVLDLHHRVLYSDGRVSYTEDSLSPLLEAADRSSPRDHLCSYTPPYGDECIALCRKIYSEESPTLPAGYLVLFLNPHIFDKHMFPTSYLGEGASIFLMDSSGQIISSQRREIATDSPDLNRLTAEILSGPPQNNGSSVTAAGDQDLIAYSYNSEYDLFMVSLIPMRNITGEIRRVQETVTVLSLVLLAACLLTSTVVYRSIAVPIEKIVAACRSAGSTVTRLEIGDTAPDELGYLSRTLEAISLNNEKMLEDLHNRDKQKRKLELEMLQYQINPHFLFNTLNTLKWIATINGVEALSTGISSLAGILRGTLGKNDELISLRQELDNLEDYCVIQNLRYAGQFSVVYQVDHETLECRVPRLLLQPLVENAILYGNRSADTLLHIEVRAFLEAGCLQILIRDDGVGFSLDTVLNQDKNRFTGIGLSNVDERLRLNYGDSCRLTIHSEPGSGTECRIAIPLPQALPRKET